MFVCILFVLIVYNFISMKFGGHVDQWFSQITWLTADAWAHQKNGVLKNVRDEDSSGSVERQWLVICLMAVTALHYRAMWLEVKLTKGKLTLQTEVCNWNLLHNFLWPCFTNNFWTYHRVLLDEEFYKTMRIALLMSGESWCNFSLKVW